MAWCGSPTRLDEHEVASAIGEGHHLVWNRPHACGERRLYAWSGDAREQRDLAAAEPIRAGYLLAFLRNRMHTLKPPADRLSILMDDELRRRVAALGYFQGPEVTLPAAGLCDGLPGSAR